MKSWNMACNYSFCLTRWYRKDCPKFFWRNLFSFHSKMIRPDCVYSLVPWAFLTLHFSGCLSTIRDILILTPFLGGGSLWLSLLCSFLPSFPPPLDEMSWLWLLSCSSQIYSHTQPPVRALQNKICHVTFLLKIL